MYKNEFNFIQMGCSWPSSVEFNMTIYLITIMDFILLAMPLTIFCYKNIVTNWMSYQCCCGVIIGVIPVYRHHYQFISYNLQ